jgi:glutathione S-transferase
VHRANSPLDTQIQRARGTRVKSYLGHAEAWVDMGKAPKTDEARRANAALIKDEINFIDMERSTFLFGKEYTIIDKR